jgi:hypothetical protein
MNLAQQSDKNERAQVLQYDFVGWFSKASKRTGGLRGLPHFDEQLRSPPSQLSRIPKEHR